MDSAQNQNFLTSVIGRKVLMSVTGIVWYAFVLTHMLGNMLIFVGPEAYNKYSHMLIKNPLILVAEGILVFTILFHAITGITLKVRNMRTKPHKYAVSPVRKKGAALSSKTMIYSGVLLLAFLIWHLITFKFGPVYTVVYEGVEMRDIYTLIVERFQNPAYVFGYIICMVLVGLHLYHGVKSSFQTLGLHHPKYQPLIVTFGYSYAVIVALGFISQPLYVFFAR